MSRSKLAVLCGIAVLACGSAPVTSHADDIRIRVSPAVLQTRGATSGATVQTVNWRHGGYYGHRGYGGGNRYYGGYNRGYGYGYGRGYGGYYGGYYNRPHYGGYGYRYPRYSYPYYGGGYYRPRGYVYFGW